MEQTAAHVALTPFLALSKSATSLRAAADLVRQATSAQGTFVFAELLAQKNIAALKTDSQYSAFHKLLEIFAWGTWETYNSTPDLPTLSDAQALKLRLLSLITYAAEKHGDLSYTTLCKRLGFPQSIDLEHLVTTAIYFNLITATLDPAEQTVVISSVAPLRDLEPGSVKSMLADLEAWSSRCDSVLAGLEAEIAKVKADAVKRATQQSKMDKQIKQALETHERAAGNQGNFNGQAGSMHLNGRGGRTSFKREAARGQGEEDEDDPMDIDGQTGGARKKSGGLFSRPTGK